MMYYPYYYSDPKQDPDYRDYRRTRIAQVVFFVFFAMAVIFGMIFVVGAKTDFGHYDKVQGTVLSDSICNNIDCFSEALLPNGMRVTARTEDPVRRGDSVPAWCETDGSACYGRQPFETSVLYIIASVGGIGFAISTLCTAVYLMYHETEYRRWKGKYASK